MSTMEGWFMFTAGGLCLAWSFYNVYKARATYKNTEKMVDNGFKMLEELRERMNE